MDYRVEQKYIVTDADLMVLSKRLHGLVAQDIHQEGNSYQIRSLYFDDIADSCLDENDAGIDQRYKYRIRHYDPNTDTMRLEIKEKKRGLTRKYSAMISREECKKIMENALPLQMDGRKVLNLLQLQMRCANLRPKAIISYERTAFVHPTGNVRITFDRNISASKVCEDFLKPIVGNPVPVMPAGLHVLEVKYDELLPDYIANALNLGSLHQTAFSKYGLGRLALQGDFLVDDGRIYKEYLWPTIKFFDVQY
ncbi:MAG: polyphosphate polymerase domain-containing protein [Clostridiaceae bacterium]|nr:polyphosphate polymerase domain-containing protein [Clostridiaceae bacterium]